MTPPPAPVAINPYHEDDLIFVMTTPPERSSKLAPRWKGPFFVKRVPNAYQVTYEDDMVWLTVHINHVKPEASLSLYLSLNHHCLPLCISRGVISGNGQLNFLNQPHQPQNHLNQPPLLRGRLNQPPPTAEPTQPAAAPREATPPPSRPTTRSSANHNLAPRSEPRSPATPGRTNENSRSGQPLRRSARLNPTAMCINS